MIRKLVGRVMCFFAQHDIAEHKQRVGSYMFTSRFCTRCPHVRSVLAGGANGTATKR